MMLNNNAQLSLQIPFEQQEINKFAAQLWAKYFLEKKENWVILHLAATGLNQGDRIVEICVISRHGSTMFDTLINPNKPNCYPLHGMQYNAQIMTGITNEMLESAPQFSDVYDRLRSLIKGKNILCYSSSFTRQKIDRMCKLYDLPRMNGIWWNFGEQLAKRENSCFVGKCKYDMPRLFTLNQKRRAKAGALNIFKYLHQMAEPLYCPVDFSSRPFLEKQLYCRWVNWLKLIYYKDEYSCRAFDLKRPKFYWSKREKLINYGWDEIPF
ncbi:MAG: exonuclease domain-containing protein [Cyanobacteria bacterium P01_G01_bin.49]